MLELELEREQLFKQISALHGQKNNMQDYAETQFLKSVRMSREQPIGIYNDLFDALRESYK